MLPIPRRQRVVARRDGVLAADAAVAALDGQFPAALVAEENAELLPTLHSLGRSSYIGSERR